MIILTAQITLDDGTEINLGKQNLINMNTNLSDRSDIILPSWGVISNGGTITFIDYDGSIKVLAQALKLTTKTIINVYLENTLNKAKMQIGEYFAESCYYDNNNKEVTVTVTDGLQKMQDVTIKPFVYDITREEYTMTATELYECLCEQATKNGFDIVHTTDLFFDNSTLEHLNKIVVSTPYIESTNLWRALDDFAIAFQLHIYRNRKGVIVCVYNGGD